MFYGDRAGIDLFSIDHLESLASTDDDFLSCGNSAGCHCQVDLCQQRGCRSCRPVSQDELPVCVLVGQLFALLQHSYNIVVHGVYRLAGLLDVHLA